MRRGTRSRPLLVLLALAPVLATAAGPAHAWTERADWAALFRDQGVSGTIVVLDERTGERLVHDPERAGTRFIPASTFKIPHALIALDAGVARDEFETYRWDGTEHPFASWNRDQNLRSSMSNSVVWVYQGFARRLGAKRERSHLRRIGYGNADVSGGVERFWLDGGLRISAVEQVEFLRRLHRNRLPFRVEHQRLVKDLILVEAGRGFILRAKTGWAFDMEPQIGWYVGWAERPDGAVFFALNIDMPDGGRDAPKREALVRAVLRTLEALPEEG